MGKQKEGREEMNEAEKILADLASARAEAKRQKAMFAKASAKMAGEYGCADPTEREHSCSSQATRGDWCDVCEGLQPAWERRTAAAHKAGAALRRAVAYGKKLLAEETAAQKGGTERRHRMSAQPGQAKYAGAWPALFIALLAATLGCVVVAVAGKSVAWLIGALACYAEALLVLMLARPFRPDKGQGGER
jgi:hypothetical protein